MQMSDSQRIPASKEKVWAALNDPAILKQCIPGCEALDMSAPTEMTATVVFRVGPVKATFGGKVTLSDLDPPNSYRISGEGSGGVAGFAKGGATVKLSADGPDATILFRRNCPRLRFGYAGRKTNREKRDGRAGQF
ncbi:MAG: carbon monoxide dehydrogenase subunit G [Xanthobacteraceae bacterium]|nr:carbon monoxide dehydrogenase subunit G [Xanthobacteraceae bacterium]